MKKNIKNRLFHQEKEGFEVSLTPLLDTVLVLLMIFILAIPTLDHVLKISLPKGERGIAMKKKDTDYFCFAINQYGSILLKNKREILLVELLREIEKQDLQKKNKYLSIVIFSDKDVLFEKIAAVMSAIRDKMGAIDIYVKTKKI